MHQPPEYGQPLHRLSQADTLLSTPSSRAIKVEIINDLWAQKCFMTGAATLLRLYLRS